jgi:hypothetical protein
LKIKEQEDAEENQRRINEIKAKEWEDNKKLLEKGKILNNNKGEEWAGK